MRRGVSARISVGIAKSHDGIIIAVRVRPTGNIPGCGGERGIAAPNAGRWLAESGKIIGHKMEALAVIGRAPYEAGGGRKSERRGHINSILRINRDAGFAGNPLMIDDDFASENRSLGCGAYARGKVKKCS